MPTVALSDRLRETLALFEEAGPPRTTPEVAADLDLGRRSTYNRLEKLVDNDRLETKKVGANARVWWRPQTTESTGDTPTEGSEGSLKTVGSDGPRSTEGSDQTPSSAGHGTASATDDQENERSRAELGSDPQGDALPRDPPTDTRTRFESLVKAVDEYAIFILDPEGHVRTWNPGAERIVGYDSEEILGDHFETFYTDVDCDDGVPEEHLATAAEEGSLEEEGWQVRADGSRFWAHVTLTAIRENGQLRGFAKVTHDVSEWRERERKLRRERDLTDRIFETAPVTLAVYGSDGSVERVNSRATDRVHLDESDDWGAVIGGGGLHEDEGRVSEENNPLNRVIETGEPVSDWRVEHDGPGGERRWTSVTATPLYDDDGDVDRVVVAGKDVTDLKRTERELQCQRDELREELDEVFERIDDAFFALDEKFRFEYVNDRAADFFGGSEAELLGKEIWSALEIDHDDPVFERFETAMETGEPTSFEFHSDPHDYWAMVRLYPSSTGLSVYFRDITERKKREEELRRYAGIVDAVGEPVYELDDHGRFTFVNDAFVERSGYDRSELLGGHVSMGMDRETVEHIESEILNELARDPDRTVTTEYEVVTKAGERFPVENHISLQTDDDGRIRGTAGMLWDLTDRKKRERELERYRQLVETVQDGVYALDEDDRFVMVNDSFCDLAGYDRSELLGEHVTLVESEAVNESINDQVGGTGTDDVGVLEYDVSTSDGETVRVENRFSPFEFGDAPTGRCGVTRNVTERKWFEETLVGLYRSTRTLVEAETADAVDELVADAVSEAIDLPGIAVYRYDQDDDELFPAAHSVEGGFMRDGDLPTVPVGDGSITGHTWESGEVRALDDVRESPHVETDETEMRGGLFVPMGDHGILVAGTPEVGGIDARTRRLVELLATNAEAAYDRVAREAELARQHRHLAALDDLNGVVRDITETVLGQSSREEIERTVCERLAAADSYEFAWIGEVDPSSRRIVSRVEAGVEGYLEDVHVSADPNEPAGQGPGGRAVRTRRMQHVQNAKTDPEFDPWRGPAREYGYRSAAAIPLVHGDTLYGLLTVYADRPEGFGEAEQAVIGQLGEVVGHAIAAIERKRALTSDEVTELCFSIDDYPEALGVDVDVEGTIRFESAVRVDEDEFLIFGRADEDGTEGLHGLVDRVARYEEVTTFDGDGDWTRFELRVSDPPMTSLVASHGGYLEVASIEDGDFHTTVHIPTTLDARRFVDAIHDHHPSAVLERRRQITRDEDALERLQRTVTRELTDRQRAALEAAVYSGFFEWPRTATGQDVAESLGIAAPTFSQHLRKAERRVFESLFSTSGTA